MQQPWPILRRTTLLKEPYSHIDRVTYTMPDGREAERDVKVGADGAAVVACTTDQQIILAWEFRPGPNLVLPCLPGGMIDPGEEPHTAAARELREETGYRAGSLELLQTTWYSGYSTARKHIFLARDCVQEGEQKLDDTELITVGLISIAEFKNMLLSGAATDIDAGLLALLRMNLL